MACTLPAQFVGPHRPNVGTRLDIPGPTGSAISHKLDVQVLGTRAAGYKTDGCIGVCVDNLIGHIWVSARQDSSSTTKPHKLLEFWWDPNANSGRGDWHIEVYDQPPVLTSKSLWGIRDLCAGSGPLAKFIYGGCERTASGNVVFAFDVTKATTGNTLRSKGWTASANWRTNGVASSITTIRALAYHAMRGTMFTASFDSPVSEFRQNGTQVQSFRPSRNFGTYGMAYDPLRETILAVGQLGSAYPGSGSAMVCYEFDPRIAGSGFLKETGTIFLAADLTIPGSKPGGFSGGCDLRIERRRVETTKSGVFNTIDVPVLTWLAQATSDTITQQYGRLQHYPYLPNGAAFPRNTGGHAGMTGDVPFLGNSNFRVTLSGSAAPSAVLALSAAAHSIILLPLGAILIDPDPLSGFLIVAPAVVASGRAGVALPVPNTSSLAGVSVFMQWVENTPTGALSTAVGFKVVK